MKYLMGYLKTITLLFIGVLLINLPVLASESIFAPSDYNLPDLAELSSPNLVQPGKAESIIRDIRKRFKIIEDPELNDWISNLGNRIARASSLKQPVYFLIANNNQVNAFATEGVVVVNSGLILKTENESELASVLAHEIAHISQKHIQRLKQDSKKRLIGTGVAVLAGIAASNSDSEAGNAIISSAMAANVHGQLSFSRDMESEADREGLRVLVRAGFNAEGMTGFLEKLNDNSDSQYSELTRYLRSHPLSIERVSDVRLRANQYKTKRRESANYLYAREKIGVETRQRRFVRQGNNQRLQKYFQALQAVKNRGAQKAITIMGHNSNVLPEAVLIAEALLQLRQYDQVLSVLSRMVRQYPHHESIAILLAKSYLGKGMKNKAWIYLEKIPLTEQTSLNFILEKQKVATALSKRSQVYILAAERSLRLAQYHHARVQLNKAGKIPDVSVTELRYIQRQLELVEYYQSL